MTIEMNIGANGVNCLVTLQRTAEFEALKKVSAHALQGTPLVLTEAERLAIEQLSRNLSRIKTA